MARWSIGKSIGRAFVQCLNSSSRYNKYKSRTNPLFYYHGCRYNYSSSSIFYSPLYPSNNSSEYPERICEMEVEAKVGSNSNLGTITSNATKSWKELKKQNIKYQKVTKGDVIDVHEFLFTKYRDYLIRYDDKTRVMAEQLAGKVIIIYFVSLSLNSRARLSEESDTFLLTDIYNYLPYKHGIEIVCVAINDENEGESKKRFEDIFSRMPWTAIPFSDVICRRNLAINFHVNDTTTLFVVNSSGTVLQRDAKFIIEDYGVLGFPYSDDRIRLLDAEDDAAVQHPSLITLLGSPQRDYVMERREYLTQEDMVTLENMVTGGYNDTHKVFVQVLRRE